MKAIHKDFMKMGSVNGCKYEGAFCGKEAMTGFYIPKNVFEGTI